ncbi:MAG: hypothetical protein AAGD43_05825 [Pseudomonadota bacterium]
MRNVFRSTFPSTRAGLAALLLVAFTWQCSAAEDLTDQFVRRGQPTVSLKLSGWISMGVMSWRDGVEHGAAVVDNGEQNSRLKFSAATRFARDFRAGANIELGLSGNFSGAGGIPSTNCIDQTSRDCGPLRPIIRTQEIWLQHKRWGKLQLGTGSPPSRLVKNFAGRIASNQFWGMDSSPQVGMNLLLRGASQSIGRLRWRHLIDGRVGPFREQLAWTSPKIANFTLSFGAGTDDHWDAAIYYANQNLWGFKVFGAIAFIEDRTPDAGLEFSEIKGSIGALHNKTGLYAWFASASRDYPEISGVDDPGGRDWYVQAGWKGKPLSLGATAIAIDFGDHANIRAGLSLPGGSTTITGSQTQFFGVGLTQWVNAAAMELYVGWRRYDVQSVTVAGGASLTFDDADVAIAGARIKF